jgi:hypothetical protein
VECKIAGAILRHPDPHTTKSDHETTNAPDMGRGVQRFKECDVAF